MTLPTNLSSPATVRGHLTDIAPDDLKRILASGLLSFPLTAFDDQGDLDVDTYKTRLDWLNGYDAAALFVCGGTGEGFSLTGSEQRRVITASMEVSGQSAPILASASGGTRVAIELAQQAQNEGAAGVLLMPHYLTEATQEGLIAHCIAVCQSVDFGVVIYNRGVCRLSPESVVRIADACPNFVSLKDGFGEVELLTKLHHATKGRLTLIGGLPTAEVFAGALLAAGMRSYSSAVFNFIPQEALRFHDAILKGNTDVTNRMLEDFFLPLIAIRNRSAGYAVSMIKAGARIVGRPAGPVRSPLVDCTPDEHAEITELVDRLAD